MSDTIDLIELNAWSINGTNNQNINQLNNTNSLSNSTHSIPTLTYADHTELLSTQLQEYKTLLLINIQQYNNTTLRTVDYESKHSLVKLKQLLHDTVRSYHAVEGFIYDDYKSIQHKQLQLNKLCRHGDVLKQEREQLHKSIDKQRSKLRHQAMIDCETTNNHNTVDRLSAIDTGMVTPVQLNTVKMQYEQQLIKIDYYTNQLQVYTDKTNTILQSNSKELQNEQQKYNEYAAKLNQLLAMDKASRNTREHKLKQLTDTFHELQLHYQQLTTDITQSNHTITQLHEQINDIDALINQCNDKTKYTLQQHNNLLSDVRQQWCIQHAPVSHCCNEIIVSYNKLLGIYNNSIQNIQIKQQLHDIDDINRNVLYSMFRERYSVSQMQVHELHSACQHIINTVKIK